jgi:hypothetical protein
MVSQNVKRMGVHYWLAEQTKAEIITTDTLAANKKCQNFFSASVTEFTKSRTNFLFI